MAHQTAYLSSEEFTVYHRAIYEIWISGKASVTRLARQMTVSTERVKAIIEGLVEEFEEVELNENCVQIRWVTELREKQESLVEAKRRGGRRGKEESSKSLSKSLNKSVSNTEKKCRGSKEEKEDKERREEKEIKTSSASVEARDAITLLNELSGKEFKHQLRPDLEARIRDYGASSVLEVIRDKVAQWKDDPEMKRYLRPETLFNRTKFEGYAEAAKPAPEPAVDPELEKQRKWNREQYKNADGTNWSPPE